MAKWYGVVGYAETKETTNPGVWIEEIVERNYYGDTMTTTRRLQGADKVNNDVVVNATISIVSDPYAIQNFSCIRYAEYMGTRWKVDSVTVEFPRLSLQLGGVWNGEVPSNTP